MKSTKTETKKSTNKTTKSVGKSSAVKTASTEKASTVKTAAKKPKGNAVKISRPDPDVAMQDRIGLTAGEIWNYLSLHGEISNAKLVKEINEEDKIIQRSIGWLAQEGKISIKTENRTEVIALV